MIEGARESRRSGNIDGNRLDKHYIDPAIAQYWVTAYYYDRQRPLRRIVVDGIAQAMQQGTFKPDTIQLAELPNGKKYLIDGNHRLHAVMKSGCGFPFPVLTWYASDKDEVDTLYARTDQTSKRTPADIWRALGVHEMMPDLTHTDLTCLRSGLGMIQSRFMHFHGRRNPESDAAEALPFYSSARLYVQAIRGATPVIRKGLRNAIGFGLGLLTIHDAPTPEAQWVAIRFWRDVACNDGLAKGDPRHLAAVHLLQTRIAQSAMMGQIVTRRERACYLAQCWNYWCQGKTHIQRMHSPDPKSALIVANTRFSD